MKLAFTICSNNYLAKAKVAIDSFTVFNPDYKTSIFLVDKFDPALDYTAFAKIEIVEIHTVIPNIISLAQKYNIIELNTAVKPDLFLHLFNSYDYESVIYLDPDLMIFDRFIEIEDLFQNTDQNVVITPHFCTPVDDGKYPSEIDFACFGLYNLGFIAVKNTAESMQFLRWWRLRLMKYCYIKPAEGMFTDQIWVNIAPIFFSGMFILKHRGYNVANWNLYERKMHADKGDWYVNGTERLKFVHFSQYEYSNPYSIAKFQTRHTIDERPDVKELIDAYQALLIQNRFENFHKSKCLYQQVHVEHLAKARAVERSVVNKIKRRIKRLVLTVSKN